MMAQGSSGYLVVISEGRHTNIKAFLRETRQPQLSIPLSYWLSSQRVLGFWVLGLVGSFLTWSLWSPKMLHSYLAFPMKLLLLWSYPSPPYYTAATNQSVSCQTMPIKTTFLLCQQQKSVCVDLLSILLLFAYFWLPMMIYYWKEKNSFPFAKRPGNLAWPCLLVWFESKCSKKKKNQNKKQPYKKKEKRKEVTFRASGSGRQEQVAELKKKWGLECEAGLGSPAAWHPKGKLSVQIGTLA